MFSENPEEIFENRDQQQKWASQPINQSPSKRRWAGWHQNTMKSNNPNPERNEIKQSQTKTQQNQTIENLKTVKSNNPKPKHSEIKQSKARTQWNQTVRNQNTMQSNKPTTDQPEGMSCWLVDRLAGCLIFFCFWNVNGFPVSLQNVHQTLHT